MKEKKNKGARKVLLMAISVALVAAISVSATLAYLTAKTEEKVNPFTASGGITGEVLEPSFDNTTDVDYKPGKTIDKDPLIQNTTEDASIYVGARLDFYINITGDTYVQVSYDEFKKYVTINDINNSQWSDVTTSATNDSTGSLYYVYKTTLASKDSNTPTAANNYSGTDSTQPIFKSVTPSPNIRIEAGRSDYQINITNPPADAPSVNYVYEKFNFRITVSGYGVKDDASIAGTTDAEKLASATTLILQGLGGLTA